MFPFPAPLLCMGASAAAPAFIPTDLGSKLLAWWDPSDLSTLTASGGGAVSTAGTAVLAMNDKSGNGKHLRQDGSSGRRPTYQVDGAGHAYLLFDGSDDVLLISPWVLNLPYDRITAMQQVTWTSGRLIWRCSTFSPLRQRGNASPDILIDDGSALLTVISSDLAVGANGVVTERHIANASKLAVNNNAYVSGDKGSTGQDEIALGATITGASAANIRFYGAIMGDGTLTDAEIAKCRTYLGSKCGLTL